METRTWYSQLKKPTWAPPPWIFGPVWSVLYVLITISFGTVFYKAFINEIPWFVVLPFIFNLVFNLIFTSIQFSLKNNLLSALDILLILSTLMLAMIVIYPYAHWITYIQIPYLLWVSFATALQITITYLNR